MKPVQCCKAGPQNSRSLILLLPKWLVHRSSALGLDKPTAQLFCTTNSSNTEHSSVLTAAPESGVHWRHAAGCSEFHFYKGSFQEERKKKALGHPIQKSYFKRHRNPKQSFLIGFKGNVLHLQHQHPEILSTESSPDNVGSGLFNSKRLRNYRDSNSQVFQVLQIFKGSSHDVFYQVVVQQPVQIKTEKTELVNSAWERLTAFVLLKTGKSLIRRFP